MSTGKTKSGQKQPLGQGEREEPNLSSERTQGILGACSTESFDVERDRHGGLLNRLCDADQLARVGYECRETSGAAVLSHAVTVGRQGRGRRVRPARIWNFRVRRSEIANLVGQPRTAERRLHPGASVGPALDGLEAEF